MSMPLATRLVPTRTSSRPKGRAFAGWKILGDVAAAMDRELRYPGAASVFDALAAEVPFFAGMSHRAVPAGGAWGMGATPPERKRLCTPR